jgi:flagellar secretion chaperone FliS
MRAVTGAMSAYSSRSTLAEYRSVATHGGVAAADPHRLVLMLMDGALERLAQARACIRHAVGVENNRQSDLLQAAISILDELRAGLDLQVGDTIAVHLDDLYDYMSRQLIKATLQQRPEIIDEVAHLLKEICAAWIALPPQAPTLRPAAK